jgi:hypothetical protein
MEQGSKGVASLDSSSRPPPYAFKRWQPGPLDAVRGFLLSERCQSATQLAAGVLFVSLFVFVDALRFPGACVAILLYFVVAVTAAPDCHIGTRIFLCGFMLGPMWLSLLLGGVIVTLAKLAPSQEGTLIILCVLGPLALIPFAINRMGTSHLYMFAMGMVSCLYLGMPILAGWAIPDFATLWERAVGYVLVAALIGMFAGSVLSMIVLPSLASHKVRSWATPVPAGVCACVWAQIYSMAALAGLDRCTQRTCSQLLLQSEVHHMQVCAWCLPNLPAAACCFPAA